ncbi:snRNA-activating protein complex subunit 1-like [Dunckerocampus dactyliophorus]|uniref:snRNA-activating protein complex subunit 1-like n=1 Tax=Dunckerocampus dactyliophorus TaxID=161453 RepID=UPI00240710E5|nr:snRNA-activating protein complex subunit 1-like [Dunckerocampus dactyliophorus]
MAPKYADNFYEPLTEDVEDLLGRFQQKDSIRFDDFSAIWRDMRFSDVFLGIFGMGEMRKFCKVAMITAAKYFLPPYCFQIRVGGLYLIYAFYHTQLVTPPVQIRLALRDWDYVQKFLQDSMGCGHLDVVYIYRKLVSSKAFHYTAIPHLLTFQKPKRPQKQKVCSEMLARATAVKELLSEDYLEEVTNIQNRYEKMKQDLEEVRHQATMTHIQFTSRLKGTLTEFVTWQQNTFHQTNNEDKEKPIDEEDSRSRATLLASIKKKSYGKREDHRSKSRRHRQEVVQSSSSGPEQEHEGADLNPGRPLSLRARTWKTLGKNTEQSELAPWLLSAPDHEGVPLRQKWQGRYKQ